MLNKFNVIVVDPPYNFKDMLSMSDVARGAEANYGTMTISQIKQLPIKSISAPDGAVLALWVPSSLLQEGLDIMKDWGFNHKQTYIWVKTKIDPLKDIRSLFFDSWKNDIKPLGNFTDKSFKDTIKKSIKLVDIFTKGAKLIQDTLAFGMGRLFRQTHEICLIGTNNNGIYKKLQNKSQRSVCFAENLKHSAKPELLQNSLDIMFPSLGENISKIEIFARRQRKGYLCLGNQAPMTYGEDIVISLNKLIKNNIEDISEIVFNYNSNKDKELFALWMNKK